MSSETNHLFSVDEAAHFLGVSAGKVRKDLREQTIPFVRIGRRVVFDPDRLRRFVADHTVEPESIDAKSLA